MAGAEGRARPWPRAFRRDSGYVTDTSTVDESCTGRLRKRSALETWQRGDLAEPSLPARSAGSECDQTGPQC